MRNKLIIFEGVDASGKTSLAKKMAKSVDGVYYYNPPKAIRSLRDYADQSLPNIRFQYYLLGNVISSEEIKALLRTKHVICDWYTYSTIAYHSVLLGKELSVPDLLFPDNIIFVSADWSEIKKRLNARKISSKYEDIDFLKDVHKHYKRLFSPLSNVVEVNTTNKNPDKMVSKLIEQLEILKLSK